MEPFVIDPNYPFVNFNMFDFPIYLSKPPSLPFYLSPRNFVFSHNQNESTKNFLIYTIDYALNKYKETYNKKFKENMQIYAGKPYLFSNSCDMPEITDVYISKANPFNWNIISHHKKPLRSPSMTDCVYDIIVRSTPSQNNFEINIYSNTETDYIIEFNNFNHSINAYFDLFREIEQYLREGPIQSRLPYLYLHTLYHESSQESNFDTVYPHIGKYLFNIYGGREICSYLM